MDRYDAGEYAGLAGIVVFFLVTVGWTWALLAASLVLLLEVQVRSRQRAVVRARPRGRRLAAVAKAARSAWVGEDAEDAAA